MDLMRASMVCQSQTPVKLESFRPCLIQIRCKAWDYKACAEFKIDNEDQHLGL